MDVVSMKKCACGSRHWCPAHSHHRRFARPRRHNRYPPNMYRRLPIWAAELAADFFPPGNCPWCDIWDDYFHDFDPSIQHWILRVDHDFHAGIELGDQSFSEVPLEIMERIAVTLRAWSFSRRDALGVLSSEVFRLIEDIIGNDRMMALGPVPNHYGPRIYNQNGVGLSATMVATDPRGMRPRLGWRA